MVCPLSKCNPACSALNAAIYVCPFVKSVNANNTCSGAKLYCSPAPRCCCIELNRLHTALCSAVLCAIAVLVMSFRANSHIVTYVHVFCALFPLLLVLYLMCNIWDRSVDVSCIIVQPNVHHQVFQSSLSCWNLIKVMSLSVLCEWSAGMYVMQLLSCTSEK